MSFFIIVDEQSYTTVTTMPSFSLCTEVIMRLPVRKGYRIYKVPMKTKMLDTEFVEEIDSVDVQNYYENINEPSTPDMWYPKYITNSQLSDRE